MQQKNKLQTNEMIGQALPDNKISAVIPECRNRGSSTHLPFRNETTNDKMPLPRHCQAKPDLHKQRRGFTRPSSPRSVSIRGIGAGRTGTALYPALAAVRRTGMTNAASGFTLIELLVVVLIIGILAAVAVPQYQLAVEKSRATEAMIWAKKLAEAEEMYYLANGSYTTDWDALGVEKPSLKYFKGLDNSFIDSSTYNIYMQRKTGDYTFRYIMQNVNLPLKGRFVCIAQLDNQLGTRVCRSFASDKEGFVYPYGGGQAYYLN